MVQKYNVHDDFPGGKCPICQQTGLECQDFKAQLYDCPGCGWSGHSTAVVDFVKPPESPTVQIDMSQSDADIDAIFESDEPLVRVQLIDGKGE